MPGFRISEFALRQLSDEQCRIQLETGRKLSKTSVLDGIVHRWLIESQFDNVEMREEPDDA